MSCIDNDISFHVKKGGVRKTVSSRRAYVRTPSDIRKAIKFLNLAIKIENEGSPNQAWPNVIFARDILEGQKIGQRGYRM